MLGTVYSGLTCLRTFCALVATLTAMHVQDYDSPPGAHVPFRRSTHSRSMPISVSASIAACMLAGTGLLTCLAAAHAAPGFPRADAMQAPQEPAGLDVDAGTIRPVYTHSLSRRIQPDLGSQLTDEMHGDDVATTGLPGRSLLHSRTKSCHRRRCGPLSVTRHVHAHVASTGDERVLTLCLSFFCYTEKTRKACHRQQRQQQWHKHNHQQLKHADTK